MFLSYLEPPGAEGGLYGSGCLHFISNFSVSVNSSCSIGQHQYPTSQRIFARTFWCLGSYTFLFASKQSLMYTA